jgi:leucyl aminopeptidase
MVKYQNKHMKILIQKEKTKKTITILVKKQPHTSFSGSTLVVGVDEIMKMNKRSYIRTIRKIIRQAQSYKIDSIALDLSELRQNKTLKEMPEKESLELCVINVSLANYNFNKYKTKPKDGWSEVKELIILGDKNPETSLIIKRGQTIAEEINKARDMANTPGSDMRPRDLAQAARDSIKGVQKTKVTVLGEKDLMKMKAGGILAVGQGSPEESKMIVMEYSGGKKGEAPIVFVGKGVTYDTGGLGIKPVEAMLGMHMDMSGGAMVVSAFTLVAKLKLKKNIVAVIPAVENSVGGKSYKNGDIVRSMSGKTIEIKHTDAEGRVILADALTYAQKKFKPSKMIDVATLTGASLVALGQTASAIFSTNEKLARDICDIGEEVGEYAWPLPLWDEYKDEIKSDIADISNIGKTRYGGAIEGGIFLAEFVDNKDSWVHMDIAPRAESTSKDQLAKGSTGEPIQTLLSFVEKM